MSNILIAGCGDVGTALGLALVDDGNRVFALRRRAEALPPLLDAIAADLSDPASLRSLPEVDHVFYTAAADRRDEAAYRRAYVDGVRALLRALADGRQAITRFVLVSSTGVYGQDAGEWVDESSPAVPSGFSGRRLLEGEAACRSGPFPSTVVRFGGIYGPGRDRLVREVEAGASCIADPPQYTNRIHRDDCAGVLRHLLSLEAAEPIYAAVDCEPAERCEVLQWLARRLGAPAPRRIAGDPSAGGGKRVSNARLLESGYRFRYPTFREGYAQVLEARAGAAAQEGS